MPALIWPPVASLIAALVLLPVIRDRAHRIGLLDEPDAVRHHHARPVPRIGGLAVILAYLTGLAVLAVIAPASVPGRVADLAASGVLVFAAGLFDDWRGLPPGVKLAVILIAATLAAGGSALSLQDVWQAAVAIAGITAVTIAFNLIDGVDGLAATVAVMTAVVLAAASADTTRAAILLPLVAALLAFLRANWTPASLFLGDGGSLSIGFLLAAHGWLGTNDSAARRDNGVLAAVAPALLFAIPLLDLAWAIIRRSRRGWPLFMADRGHLHHRLLDRGWGAARISLTLAAVSAGLGGLAIAVQRGANLLAVPAGLAIVVFLPSIFQSTRSKYLMCHLINFRRSSNPPGDMFAPSDWAAHPGAD